MHPGIKTKIGQERKHVNKYRDCFSSSVFEHEKNKLTFVVCSSTKNIRTEHFSRIRRQLVNFMLLRNFNPWTFFYLESKSSPFFSHYFRYAMSPLLSDYFEKKDYPSVPVNAAFMENRLRFVRVYMLHSSVCVGIQFPYSHLEQVFHNLELYNASVFGSTLHKTRCSMHC